MTRPRYRFESEVHFGLLIIVFLLLALNFVSNYVLYRARASAVDEVVGRLQSASLALTRLVQEQNSFQVPDSVNEAYCRQFHLSGLLIIPSRPPDESPESKRLWFGAIAGRLPQGQLPEVAEKILTAGFRQLKRGSGSEYFYVDPIPNAGGYNLLVMSVNDAQMAYFDSAHRLIFTVGIGALVIVGLAYLFVSRLIFRPFRRIKQEAARAGRTVDNAVDDAESVVVEYRRIIDELRAKEAELLRLNAEIQGRADSLEEFNRYLLRSVDTGVVTLSLSGQVRTINSAASIILSIDSPDIQNLKYQRLFSGCPRLVTSIESLIQSGVLPVYQEMSLTSEGQAEKTIGTSVSFIRDPDGQVVGVSVLMNDLTELARLRSELEKNHRLAALGEMAGGLAHQLRNSVGAIAGYGHLLKKKLLKSAEPADHAVALLEEAREAENLISRFLSFAKPMDVCPVGTDFDRFVTEIVESFRVRDDCRGIEFRASCRSGCTVAIDPLLLKQAVSNIIDNAINSYESRAGVVEATATVENGELMLTIADHGCGISGDSIDKIFTPFYSSRPSGTGLGLALAARLVDLHGGRITVDSKQSAGTRFTIHLPLTKGAPSAKAATGRPVTTA